ncbi:secretion protein [Ruegeria atlantica]|uniref:secretion protein n=1 Tax=Ruegeria atlantica TaxID=81569 RepID=UPI00147E36F0|nr:secretion protein [Ruegeria atlantica]
MRSHLAPALLMLSLFAGCDAIREADGLTDELTGRISQEGVRLSEAQRALLQDVDRPYYGQAVLRRQTRQNGEPMPQELERPDSISISTGGSAANIETLANLIHLQANIPVKVRNVYSLPNNQVIRLPINTTMQIDYEGKLSGLLDQIGARTDTGWSFDGTAITIDRMITRRYRVSLPVGSPDLETQIGGIVGTGSDGGSGGQRNVSFSRNINNDDVWADFQAQLAAVAPPPAHLTIARSTGRVIIFGPPSVQKKAEEVIADFEEIYSTRIAIEVAVYFLDTSKTDNFALGLEGSGSHGAISGAVGALTGNGVATLSNDFGSINFQALASDSAVVDYRLASTIAQSGTIAPIVLPRSQNYVSKIAETRNEDGTTTTSVETATIDTGISIHALPRLVDGNRVQLSLTILQNDLTALETFDSGAGSLQLPTVDQRAIQNDSILAPGETLILSGYEQDKATRANTGTGRATFFALGGRATGETGKIRMMVLVRPAVIPVAR